VSASVAHPVQLNTIPEVERLAAIRAKAVSAASIARIANTEVAEVKIIRPAAALMVCRGAPFAKPEANQLIVTYPTGGPMVLAVPSITRPVAEPFNAARSTIAPVTCRVPTVVISQAKQLTLTRPSVVAKDHPIPRPPMSGIARMAALDFATPSMEQARVAVDFRVKVRRAYYLSVRIPRAHKLPMRFQTHEPCAENLPEPLALLAEVHNRVMLSVSLGVRILGELDEGEESLQHLAKSIREIIERKGPARGSRFLWREFPGAAAMFLVGAAIYGFRHNEYWDAVRRLVPLKGMIYQRLWGRSFVLFLTLLGLPPPRREGQKRDRPARAYVGPILLHAMIPNDCLRDFFETCVVPAVTDKWVGLKAHDLIAEWIDSPSAFRAAIGTPICDLLQFGGPVTERLVEGILAMARRCGGTADGDGAAVPPRRIVEAYERWTSTRDAKQLPQRIRKPFLGMDLARGVLLHLPQQLLTSRQGVARGIWRIEPLRQTRLVPAWRTADAVRTSPDEFSIPPLISFHVKFEAAGATLGEWQLKGIDPARPWKAFSSGNWEELDLGRPLPAEKTWLVLPQEAAWKPEVPSDGPNYFDGDWYLHQCKAIEKATAGRNLIVATGTGSGKTETFMLPIVDALLREQEAGTLSAPGVRALLLYPMNALANDQLKRLRRLLAPLPEITFGRYTGQTAERRDRAETEFREMFPNEPRIDNELICRDDIRDRPPHILLTNYAMLEYLLLRPEDTTLFDGTTGRHWAYIVVDEAHTYSGAAGMEVGMLLRRLKDRVAESRPGPIRCIATSATLGRGEAEAIQFAQQLFGEKFEWEANDAARQDIVKAAFESKTAWGTAWGRAAPEVYVKLQDDFDDAAAMARTAETSGVPSAAIRKALLSARIDPAAFLYELLRGDERVHALRDAIGSKPLTLDAACKIVFDAANEESLEALIALVALCVAARPATDAMPLVPARYHLFAKALEGAFVTFPSADAPRLHLESVVETIDDGRRCCAFEIASCPRCGHLFIIGEAIADGTSSFPEGGSLQRLRRIPEFWSAGDSVGERKVFTWDYAPGEEEDEDEAEMAEAAQGGSDAAPWTLCAGCGAVQPGNESLACGCGPVRHMPVWELPTREGRLATCPSCKAQSADAANRLMTGQDAPVAVLATSLYQFIPPDPSSTSVGQGRKLLVFSDSRQGAAYFAPYLQSTHDDLLHRRLIAEALQCHHQEYGAEPARPHGLCETHLRQLTGMYRIFEAPADAAREQKARCTWMFQELLGFQRRIGLEGAGILSVRYSRPVGWESPESLRSLPWSLGTDEAWSLAEALLDTLRLSGAVAIEPADITSDDFEPRNRLLFFREQVSQTASGITVLGWLPNREKRHSVTNRRFDYLSRYLKQRRGASVQPEAVVAILRELWQSLTKTVLKGVILSKEGLDVCYHLDPRHIELRYGASKGVLWLRCPVCQSVAVNAPAEICPTMGCTGVMQTINSESALAADHYRRLYRHMILPPPARAGSCRRFSDRRFR
jgi:hypothetical protein